MLKIIWFLGALASGGFCVNLTQYFQNDFIMKTEHFELVEYNKDYMLNPVVKNFKYNRTNSAVNVSATWKNDISGHLIGTIQAYKFSSNEYRLFPITFPYDLCDVLDRKIFGVQNLYDCGKMFRCPIKKGYFNFCNWDFDYTKFPPHFPRGRYMFTLHLHESEIQIAKSNWYVEITDVPLPY